MHGKCFSHVESAALRPMQEGPIKKRVSQWAAGLTIIRLAPDRAFYESS